MANKAPFGSGCTACIYRASASNSGRAQSIRSKENRGQEEEETCKGAGPNGKNSPKYSIYLFILKGIYLFIYLFIY